MRTAGAAAVLAAALSFPGAAAAIPDRPEGWVSDFAGVIDAGARAGIAGTIAGLEKETSAEIAVVTVSSLDGLTVEDYAIRLAQKWKVGKKGKDNGVIILVAPNERKVRIEVGYGLEAVLPDGKCGEIIRESMTPAFRRGDYGGGIRAAVDRIAGLSTGETREEGAIQPVLDRLGTRRAQWLIGIVLLVAGWIVTGYGIGKMEAGRWWGVIVAALAVMPSLLGSLIVLSKSMFLGRESGIALAGVPSMVSAGIGWSLATGRSPGSSAILGGPWWREGGSGLTGRGWGGGGGGGFGGFGGGSFGGGGASGSW